MAEKKAVTVAQERPADLTPMQMLQMVVQQGADPAKMSQMMDLADRWEKKQAEKSFIAAMAEFKVEAPSIIKSKSVGYATKGTNASSVSYKHSTLADVCDGAVSQMAKYGFSHSWKLDQSKSPLIKVTCVLTHRDGHSEERSLEAGPDTTGSKNSIQAVASTVTYLERYTLLAVLGLASKDQDDDARGAGEAPELLSEEQVANIKAMLTEINADMSKFLQWAQVSEISQILAKNYKAVVREIERKRAKS